jgi:hypothetical protein
MGQLPLSRTTAASLTSVNASRKGCAHRWRKINRSAANLELRFVRAFAGDARVGQRHGGGGNGGREGLQLALDRAIAGGQLCLGVVEELQILP